MQYMLTKAIVRPPAASFSEGLTTAGLGAPDYHQALEQHAAYCAALEKCGLNLIRLEADERFPDSCFVEDAAVVIGTGPLDHRREGSTADRTAVSNLIAVEDAGAPVAVLTRPGAPSRRGEIENMRSQLAGVFPSIHELQSPGTLDGGDVCEAGTHFFLGISERTNESGARQLAEILTTHGYTSSFVDIATSGHAQNGPATSLLHLKSGVAYLAPKTLVITKALAVRAEFAVYDLIAIVPGEEYAANCIQVNGHVLIAAGYPRLEAKLRASGYQIIVLEMSEFQKMDGGLSCLSVRW